MRSLKSCTPACPPELDFAANPWPGAGLPRGPAAVLASLHMRDPRPDALAVLTDAEWRRAIEFADSSLLTLPLRRAAPKVLPRWLVERLAEDAAKNCLRLGSATELYSALDERFHASGIPYLALKGLAHCPQFGTPAESRVQYDIDLYVPPDSVARASRDVLTLGFEPLAETERAPTDHLPPFIRRTGWQWRGDYFDPAIPLSIELHFQFWNEPVERLPVPGIEQFWGRRTLHPIAGIDIPVLAPPDALGYAALHLLRHVLRGSARPFHIYELAAFLALHSADDAFWHRWRALHSAPFRRLQAVMFRLASEWFGCELGAIAGQEIAGLPLPARAWFDEFALSPAKALFHAEKDEVWLHLSLLDRWQDKLAAARLRLFPVNLPGPIEVTLAATLPWNRRMARSCRYASYVASRLRRHAAALPRAARSGLRWWRRKRSLEDRLAGEESGAFAAH